MWRAVGDGQDLSLDGGQADDVGPRCCVVVHRRNVTHHVVRPAHEEAPQACTDVADVGHLVGVGLDFAEHVAC